MATPRQDMNCQACGDPYQGTPKSTRCGTCKSEGRKVRTRKCVECSKQFNLTDESHITCPSCADIFGVEQWDMSPERAEELRAERRKLRWQENLTSFREWLDARECPPRKYKNMSKTTAKQPIGILWLQICHADGAASAVTYVANTDLSEADKLSLLTSFMRLRVKGYHPSVLAQLCPVALLATETQEALTDIPKVTESEPHVHMDAEQDRESLALSLGLG